MGNAQYNLNNTQPGYGGLYGGYSDDQSYDIYNTGQVNTNQNYQYYDYSQYGDSPYVEGQYGNQSGYMDYEYSYDNYQNNGQYSSNLSDDYSFYGSTAYAGYINNSYDYGASAGSYDEQQYVLQNYEEDDEPFITVKDILSLGICIVLAFLLAYITVTYVVQHTMVDGTSMSYNLADKDILIIDRLTYHFQDPERFDIVVFPVKDDTFYIKRVIGLPGEQVKVDKETGSVYINGNLLQEDYGFEEIRIVSDNCDVTLGDDEYFVMGDNRNDSQDSRFSVIGNIRRDELTGKAVFRIWPFSTFGQIDNLVNARIKSGENEKPYNLNR